MRKRSQMMRLFLILSLLLTPLLHAERPLYALDNGLGGIKAPQQQAALLKKLGYDGIVTRPNWCKQAMVDAFDKEGLKILATYVVIPAGETPPAELEKHFELIRTHKTIVWLGISKPKGKQSTDEDAAATARQVVDLAAKYDLSTCLYPHVGFHADTVKSCERLHQLTQRPKLGLGFTLCHFLAQNPHSELEATLKRIAPHLMLVQVSGADELKAPKIDWKQLIQPLGSGTFDVGRVLKTLDEIKYQGPVTLQCFNIKEPAAQHLSASMQAWKGLNPS